MSYLEPLPRFDRFLRTLCRSRYVLAFLLWEAMAPATGLADFTSPTRLTGGEGKATHVALGMDVSNNAYVVSVVDDVVVVDVIGSNLRATLKPPQSRPIQGEPTVVINSFGHSFVAFTQADSGSGGGGAREILLTVNRGGGFEEPENLSRSSADDRAPRMALDGRGRPHLVWCQTREPGEENDRVVYYSPVTGESRVVATGEDPEIAIGRGVVHIVFRKDSDLHHIHDGSGEFSEPVKVENTPTVDETRPQLALNTAGRPVITYERAGTLYFTSTRSSDRFATPRPIERGGVSDSRLRVFTGNTIAIVYVKNGDVQFIRGVASSDFLLPPEMIGAATGEAELGPDIGVDDSGNLHAVFLRSGEVYYTNNAGDVTAEFSASPRSGEIPLTVDFQDLSSGDVQAWNWDFGDGQRSRSRNPQHTYTEEGKYTVTLSVFNADRESTSEKKDFIVVQEPSNTMEIYDQSVVPGLAEVWFPVVAGHRQRIRGFQIMAVYDPNVLIFKDCSLNFTRTADHSPEFFECNRVDNRIEIGSLFDIEPPFDSGAIPPGENHNLVNLIFSVSRSAPQGGETEIRLVNDSEISIIFNVFAIAGKSRLPVLESSTVTIVPVFPRPRLFLRGDADSSGTVDITDAVKILNYLFIGGRVPECLDGADFNDTGRVDITSAIGVLNFLFLGGDAPRPPFPALGIDPSPDSLDCSF